MKEKIHYEARLNRNIPNTMNREKYKEILKKYHVNEYNTDVLDAMQEAVDLALQQSYKVPTKEIKWVKIDLESQREISQLKQQLAEKDEKQRQPPLAAIVPNFSRSIK